MVKRTVTETIYEYDKQGNIIKKTVTETHEEEDNTNNQNSDDDDDFDFGDDDDEFDKVADAFDDELMAEYDYDEDENGEDAE